jgi:hypothetical protein
MPKVCLHQLSLHSDNSSFLQFQLTQGINFDYINAKIVLTTVLQQCYNSVTTELQQCYNSVTTVLQQCLQ